VSTRRARPPPGGRGRVPPRATGDSTLLSVDHDGALAEALDGLGESAVTRADLLRRSVVGGGLGVATASIFAGLAPPVSAQTASGPLPVPLSRRRPARRCSSPRWRAPTRPSTSPRCAASSGRRRSPGRRFAFGAATGDPAAFLATAIELESTGVQAYKGQAPLIRSRAILAAALSIHSVEAKHTAWVRLIAGKVPIVVPLDKPLTRQNVLNKLARAGFIVAA